MYGYYSKKFHDNHLWELRVSKSPVHEFVDTCKCYEIFLSICKCIVAELNFIEHVPEILVGLQQSNIPEDKSKIV